MKNKQSTNPWQPEINSSTSLNDGCKHILITRLQSLAKVLDAQNKSENLSPKLVHKIRVASRKLTTAIKLFKQVAPRKMLVKVQIRTKKLMDHFGPMRNWDVFYKACNKYNKGSTPENSKPFLQGFLWANRISFEKDALKFFNVKAEKLVFRLLKTSSKLITSENKPASTSFFEWSKLSLMKIVDEFKTNINTVIDSKEGLHAFRLKIKYLRYGLEIMGDAIPFEISLPLYDALRKGQKILGMINDLHFQIEETALIQSSTQNQKDIHLLNDDSENCSFLIHSQQLLETNMKLFFSWQETITHLIEF